MPVSGQGVVGGRGNVLELSAIYSTHTRQIAFDDIAFHSPYSVFVSTDRTIVLFANIKPDVNIDNIHG